MGVISSYWLSYGIPQNVVLKLPGYTLPKDIELKVFKSGYHAHYEDLKFREKLKSFIRHLLRENEIQKRGLYYLYIRTKFKRGGMFPIFVGKV